MNDLEGNAIATFTYVNVYRRACGKITTSVSPTLENAMLQQNSVDRGEQGTKVVARIRVPVVCVEGQFDF